MRHALVTLTILFVNGIALSKPPLPLPKTAFDGGVISAETLGRGGTIASNRGTPSSGSENPAALASDFPNSVYTTIMFEPRSALSESTVDQTDALENKTLQYLAIGAEKGVLFFEPISRFRQRQITNEASPTTDFRDIEFSANALGFAGVSEFGRGGSFGLSLSYLWSSISSDENSSTSPRVVTADTADGLRLNFGIRYPKGPTMWGLSVQNIPAFLWSKDFKREILPIKIRAGTTWRVQNGLLFSVDAERRYYDEGGDDEDYFYAGFEAFASKNFTIRGGAYGLHLDRPEDRHWTAGATLRTKDRTMLTYAYEIFELNNEKVKRSVMSVQFPFANEGKGQ